MRFRAGLVAGFGAGFYLGTMAGRERYHQINRLVRRAKRSKAVDAVADRAKAVVAKRVGKVADDGGDGFGHNRDPDRPETSYPRLAPAVSVPGA